MAGTSDILMMLVKSGSSGMAAESQSTLSALDKLLDGAGPYPTFEEGRFFELEGFSMSLAAQSSDTAEEKKGGVTIINAPKVGATQTGKRIGRGATWLPANLNPISCTRMLDQASPVLFEECGKGTSFAYAAIVKRKVVGGGRHLIEAKEHTYSHILSYMRLDFTKVVITELMWANDDDGIKETINFVCDKAEVQYRQQMQTGTVAAKQLPPGVWQK